MNLSTELLTYLSKWYATSTRNKANDGAIIELTFDQFLSLFEERQLDSLQKAIVEGRLTGQQFKTNPFAYVLTWKSYDARSSNVFSIDTACVCSRQKSEALSKPARGDKLRKSHRESISDSLVGVPKTQEHCNNISASLKGKPKKGWTPERRLARSKQIAERNAAKAGAV